jgi:hypothetical protein
MNIESIAIDTQTRFDWEGSFRHELELMMEMFQTTCSDYTPNEFLEWRQAGTLSITPKFQRRDVWKTPARSYFIDSLLRGMPVPPIYLRLVQSADTRKQIREVIDGQQRLNSVIDYIDGKFRLSKNLQAPWSNQFFDGLTENDQRQIMISTFTATIFKGISDEQVLEIFARLNTYSVRLNSQELRNGQFFGAFKQTVYRLAVEHLTFWRKHRVFTEMMIARMLEAEYTSELLIAGHSGMQDKKKSVDKFYADFDETYPTESRDAKRFRQTMGEISEVFDNLAGTEFNHRPHFYTLYCVVFHHLFGMPKQARATPKKPLTAAQRRNLLGAVTKLSEVLESAKEYKKGKYPKSIEKYAQFIDACTSQTDNIKPRQTRFSYLFDEAF